MILQRMQIFGLAGKSLLHRNPSESASAEIIHRRSRFIFQFNGRVYEVKDHNNETTTTKLRLETAVLSDIR